MSPHGYEELDHPADLALHVWGEDFQTLLNQSAEGMYQLMGVSPSGAALESVLFSFPAASREALLVDFLSELIYLLESRQLIMQAFEFEFGEATLTVAARGRKVQSLERLVKAVTFHDLEVNDSQQGVEATITFDV